LYPNSSTRFDVDDVEKYGCAKGCLFNIRRDPEERHNLYLEEKDVVRRLEGRLAELQASVYQTGVDGESDCENPAVVMRRQDGYYGPFCHLN
jgi:hypothetical protein